MTLSLPPLSPGERKHPNWWHGLLLLAWLPWWWWSHSWGDTPALLGWLLLVILVLAIAEGCQPQRHDWRPDRTDLQRDAGAWSMSALADAATAAGLLLLLLPHAAAASSWPLWLQILVGLPLAEFGSYWLHRLSHSHSWLWQVHLLHHRPQKLNLANSLTSHPINAAYDKAARLLPLLLLGWQAEAILAIGMFQLLQALAVHANLSGSIGPLNWIVGSAELHRLHHSSDRAQAGNYGTALPLWDQIFGTWRPPAEVRQAGVYEPDRYPGEHALLALLAWPFRPSRDILRGARCCVGE